ncbi:MAG: flagellar hook-associated protein FlgL [Clostridia bacterium]|nr:flagellar hook-associated protein FlgL [Clostridia bacterium]
MRITNNVMIERSIRNINSAFQRYQMMQEQVGSGRRINRLSDDPHGAAKAVRLRSALRGADQHKKNAENASTEITAYDDTLDKIGNILNRTRELVVRAGTDSVTPTERQAIAVEVGQLFEEVVQSANSMHNGQYMFAGHQGMEPPFEVLGNPPTGVIYRGDAGKNTVEVGPGVVLSPNLTGDEVFVNGVNLFDTFLTVENHLKNDNVQGLSGSDLSAVDAAMDKVLRFRAELGGKGNRLELVINRLDSDKVSLTELLSKTEGVDFTEAVMRLSEQEIVYHAALAAASKSVQSGLLQYLR